jgi:uncharacterized protein
MPIANSLNSCMRSLRVPLLSISLAASLFSSGALAAEGSASDDESAVGSVWWSEVVSPNPARSREFYANVFGWTPKVVSSEDTSRSPTPGEEEYTVYTHAGIEIAGGAVIDSKSPNAARPGWVTYIQVASVDDAIVEVVKNGGKIIKAPYDSENTGRFAVIEDPDGIVVGLVNPVGATPAH